VVTPSWSRGEIREADRDGMLSPDLDRRMLNVVQGPVCTRHAILTGPCLSVIRPKISSDWRCQCTSRILTELCKEWIGRTYLLVGLGRMSKAISRTNIGSGIRSVGFAVSCAKPGAGPPLLRDHVLPIAQDC
jgi:hypothetical protein